MERPNAKDYGLIEHRVYNDHDLHRYSWAQNKYIDHIEQHNQKLREHMKNYLDLRKMIESGGGFGIEPTFYNDTEEIENLMTHF